MRRQKLTKSQDLGEQSTALNPKKAYSLNRPTVLSHPTLRLPFQRTSSFLSLRTCGSTIGYLLKLSTTTCTDLSNEVHTQNSLRG